MTDLIEIPAAWSQTLRCNFLSDRLQAGMDSVSLHIRKESASVSPKIPLMSVEAISTM